MDEVKPCPFCGSSEVTEIIQDHEQIAVVCINCGSRGPGAYIPEKGINLDSYIENAYKAWNRRATND